MAALSSVRMAAAAPISPRSSRPFAPIATSTTGLPERPALRAASGNSACPRARPCASSRQIGREVGGAGIGRDPVLRFGLALVAAVPRRRRGRCADRLRVGNDQWQRAAPLPAAGRGRCSGIRGCRRCWSSTCPSQGLARRAFAESLPGPLRGLLSAPRLDGLGDVRCAVLACCRRPAGCVAPGTWRVRWRRLGHLVGDQHHIQFRRRRCAPWPAPSAEADAQDHDRVQQGGQQQRASAPAPARGAKPLPGDWMRPPRSIARWRRSRVPVRSACGAPERARSRHEHGRRCRD